MVVTFKEENTITFKHLFLKDYVDGSDETHAVYTQADVYDHMFYAVDKVRRATASMWVVNLCERVGTN